MSIYFVGFLLREWGVGAVRVAMVAEMQPMCTTSCMSINLLLEDPPGG